MKFIKENFFRLATIASVVIYSLHISSCASTKIAPTGGPKDTIPPVVVEEYPASNSLNFPLTKGEIEIVFDEYVQVKDAQKNILLSPPQKKNVKTRIKGKSIIVTFQDTLDKEQTYCLNFGGAIVDNNEGNILQGFSYTFSTGDTIDSMMFSGTVVDYATLFPMENVTVALYLNPSDSCVINELPDAVAKTDKWGYFTVRNIKPLPYAVFAFTDNNNNNKYDQGSESIAFLDTLFTPIEVMRKNSPQLKYYDMLDTLACLARPSEMDLYLFAEKPTRQYIKDYKRPTVRGAYVSFNAPNVQIDSFSIRGISDDKLIKQFNITNDSLSFWINEGGKLADTLLLGIKYHKTDSTGNLSPAVENLKLVAPIDKSKGKKREAADPNAPRKDLLTFTSVADASMVEQNGIIITFPEPLVNINLDTIEFTTTTPKQITSKVEYTFTRDTIEINKYTIRPAEEFKKGNDYKLYLPKATFRDINGFTNDSTVINITLPTDDNLSSITLDITGVEGRYIVELINETRNTLFRQYIINRDSKLLFPYLKEGKYSIRITQDKNNNTLLDTGNLLERKQPEKVLLYKLKDGNDVITLPARTDIEQSVDLMELFGEKKEKNEQNN